MKIKFKRKSITAITFMAVITGSLLLESCVQNSYELSDESQKATKLTVDPSGKYQSDQEYNLNIVYFYPKGGQPLANYQERLSGLMTYAQQYFADEMEYNGFERKSFSFLRNVENPSMIKVITIEGKDESYLAAEGGPKRARDEIRAYYDSHPGEEASEHSIIFMPSITGEHGCDSNTGRPLAYFASGKWCHVVDYLNFDIKHFRTGTEEGDCLKIGSVMHEMMHALGVPHDREKYGEDWECLMSGGGGKLSKIASTGKVHVTQAAAAILDVNQVMNGNGEFYANPAPEVKINLMEVKTDDQNNIKFKVDASSDIPLKYVSLYHDEFPAGVNLDYDAIAWMGKFDKDGVVNIEMPINEFYPNSIQNSEYELRIIYVHEDGSQTTQKIQYEIENGQPNLDIYYNSEIDVEEASKDSWQVLSATSEELATGATSGPKENLIDGDITTFWHSKWTSPASTLPQSFVVDMGEIEKIKGFVLSQRQQPANGSTGYLAVHVNDFSIDVSDDNTNWRKLGDFNLLQIDERQVLRLEEKEAFRYFKVTVNSTYQKNTTALAEIGAF